MGRNKLAVVEPLINPAMIMSSYSSRMHADWGRPLCNQAAAQVGTGSRSHKIAGSVGLGACIRAGLRRNPRHPTQPRLDHVIGTLPGHVQRPCGQVHSKPGVIVDIHVGKWVRQQLESSIGVRASIHVDLPGGVIHKPGEDFALARRCHAAPIVEVALLRVWSAVLHVIANTLIVLKSDPAVGGARKAGSANIGVVSGNNHRSINSTGGILLSGMAKLEINT